MLTAEELMKPRMLALSLALVALGAGAEAASLPRPFSPAERHANPAVRRAPRGGLPKAVRPLESERHRQLGPTHVGNR
jgi:hypothetical protein